METFVLSEETPEDNENLELDEINEYNLYNNEKEYIFQIGKVLYKEKIGFKIKEKNSDIINIFSNYLSLEELRKISKAFRIFDNINEVLNSLKNLVNEKNMRLKNENNKLSLIFEINQTLTGKEIIEIKLEKKELSLREINEILINDIKNMKIEIQQIKNYSEEKIKKLENEIEGLKKEKNDLKYLKKEIELLKNENKVKNLLINELLLWKEKLPIKNDLNNINEPKINIDSKIINKKEELDFIENKLKNMAHFKNKNLSYNLIFRGTKDGGQPVDFHNKVDGKGKTITIIETTKGIKFGGYIDQKWDNYSGWITDDENCFVFSISLNKIYNPIKGKRKYLFGSNCGPNFASFGLEENLFKESCLNIKIKQVANKFFSTYDEDYEINGGMKSFTAKEIEVFQIDAQ